MIDTGSALDVLLVEDEPSDVELMKLMLKEWKTSPKLHVSESGAEALKYLDESVRKKSAKLPDLIFLDLNLPGVDGRQVLKQIKSNESLRSIPVLVLTTSNAKSDMELCYRLGANCYLTKAADLDTFKRLMKSVENFWIHTAKIP